MGEVSIRSLHLTLHRSLPGSLSLLFLFHKMSFNDLSLSFSPHSTFFLSACHSSSWWGSSGFHQSRKFFGKQNLDRETFTECTGAQVLSGLVSHNGKGPDWKIKALLSILQAENIFFCFGQRRDQRYNSSNDPTGLSVLKALMITMIAKSSPQ